MREVDAGKNAKQDFLLAGHVHSDVDSDKRAQMGDTGKAFCPRLVPFIDS
ncbi:hypothetical protein GCM10027299_40770 [Larkinella ripae]